MEPVSEVYVVLSGKDLVYVTMNLPDAEGLQYRLNEAGVDAAVGPAVLVTQDRYSELSRSTFDVFSKYNERAMDGYINQLLSSIDSLRNERDKARRELLAKEELITGLMKRLHDAQKQEKELREEVAVLVEEADKSLAECLESLKKKR